MGIVNSANEAFGYLEEDIRRALAKLPATVGAVLKRADDENISTHDGGAPYCGRKNQRNA